MGRRSRKRTAGAHAVPRPSSLPSPGAAIHARTPDRRARRDEAPKAPWAPLPLGELCVLVGMVLIVGGFAFGGDHAGRWLVVGFSLVSVAGIELAVREHAAGFRSHSALLAGCAAIVLVLPLFFLTHVAQAVLLILGVVFFGVGFQALRTVFARRSGGLGFRA